MAKPGSILDDAPRDVPILLLHREGHRGIAVIRDRDMEGLSFVTVSAAWGGRREGDRHACIWLTSDEEDIVGWSPVAAEQSALGQRDMLAQALGDVLVTLGVCRQPSMTGPELLVAADSFVQGSRGTEDWRLCPPRIDEAVRLRALASLQAQGIPCQSGYLEQAWEHVFRALREPTDA